MVKNMDRDELENAYWALRWELKNRLPSESPRHLLIYTLPLALGVAAVVAGPSSFVAIYFAGIAAIVVAVWGLYHRFLPYVWQDADTLAIILGGLSLGAGIGLGFLLRLV